jgi:S1-C subfamily serine protease
VPVLHFFTNTHADYHKPSDDWEKIDAAGLEKVSNLVALVAAAIADRGQTLTLRRGAGQPPPPPGSSGSGYGAYLGTVPDFTPVDRGVKLSGVTAGSPADKAGIRSGDVVVAIGGKDIADLQAMTDALRAHKPGETVTVGVLRDGVARTLNVTLGDRAALRQ